MKAKKNIKDKREQALNERGPGVTEVTPGPLALFHGFGHPLAGTPAVKVIYAAEHFVKAEADPQTGKAEAEMDAEQPACAYAHEPAGEGGDDHRENHVPGSPQGELFNVVEAAENFDENVDGQQGAAGREDDRIIGEQAKQRVTEQEEQG